MFGLGIWEILLILMAVIIFIKPEDLPGFFRKAGYLYGNLRRYNREVTRKIREIEYDIRTPPETAGPDITKGNGPEKKEKTKRTQKHKTDRS
ncbi:MAG: twin-arginine translocase TatA/TatE family subunit [Spirochaetales bacterium]|nr:twin-arginine translocase TatA/TatE family subunit [Spirochaetales bacterium]